jgi:hypothetical protein
MDISDDLIEALDRVAETWTAPKTSSSSAAAQEAGRQLLDLLAVEYDYIGTADEVVPDLVNELMSRETTEGGEWHKRTAALGWVIEGVIQAKASEQARDN